MERIDVSSTYVHLTWSLWFLIYIMACLYGFYTIWTDLREDGGRKESWIMAGLVVAWLIVAVIVYQVTEAL